VSRTCTTPTYLHGLRRLLIAPTQRLSLPPMSRARPYGPMRETACFRRTRTRHNNAKKCQQCIPLLRPTTILLPRRTTPRLLHRTATRCLKFPLRASRLVPSWAIRRRACSRFLTAIQFLLCTFLCDSESSRPDSPPRPQGYHVVGCTPGFNRRSARHGQCGCARRPRHRARDGHRDEPRRR